MFWYLANTRVHAIHTHIVTESHDRGDDRPSPCDCDAAVHQALLPHLFISLAALCVSFLQSWPAETLPDSSIKTSEEESSKHTASERVQGLHKDVIIVIVSIVQSEYTMLLIAIKKSTWHLQRFYLQLVNVKYTTVQTFGTFLSLFVKNALIKSHSKDFIISISNQLCSFERSIHLWIPKS